MAKPRKGKAAEALDDAFEPHVRRNPACLLGGTRFARVYVLAQSFRGVRVVERIVNIPSQLGVRERYLSDVQLANYPVEVCSLQSALQELKEDALAEGASPEAVLLIGAWCPFTNEELNTMAEKLTKKSATAKKAAAPKTTAAPKTAAKAKSEGAVGAAQDFKYKHEMTPKQAAEKVRAGTWTGRMLEIIMNNKDSASARDELAKDKEYSDRRLDFGWAEKKGFITKS